MNTKIISCQEFSLLYTAYRAKFCSIARSYVRDAEISEDIVDECFTNFWDNRESIVLTDIPEAYILQSVKNKCLNHLRDKATHMRIHQEIQEEGYKAMMAEIEIMTTENIGFLLEDEVKKIFVESMKNCPELSRNIFLASRFHNLTYEDIAEKYNISPRKVKREIQKILTHLKLSLKDYI